MTTSAPSLVSTLGKAVQIGGFEMYIRRNTDAGFFTVTHLVNNEENSEADFFVQNGQVHLMCVQAAILMPFGGGELGRHALCAALQAALKVPAPKVETVTTPAPVSELELARQAWLGKRTLENARRFNAAWAARKG